MEWFEANIPYQNMKDLKLHFREHLEVDMKIGDLVEFDGRIFGPHSGIILGIIVGKWEKTPEPIARPYEIETYWKIQFGNKTIHLEEKFIRRLP